MNQNTPHATPAPVKPAANQITRAAIKAAIEGSNAKNLVAQLKNSPYQKTADDLATIAALETSLTEFHAKLEGLDTAPVA